jgi:hypothetical protein
MTCFGEGCRGGRFWIFWAFLAIFGFWLSFFFFGQILAFWANFGFFGFFLDFCDLHGHF